MHVPRQTIHAYQNRAADVTITVTTNEDTTDFTEVTFRFSDVEKLLTPEDTSTGFLVDFTIGADDVPDSGLFDWELLAALSGEVRTLGHGLLAVDAEPTTSEDSS